MSKLTFKGYTAKRIIFENNIKETVTFELEYIFETKLDVNEKDKKCRCSYAVKITDKKHEQPLSLEVELVGLFSYESDIERTEIHKLAAADLFPYLRTAVSSIANIAGMPTIILPSNDLKDDDIKKFD